MERVTASDRTGGQATDFVPFQPPVDDGRKVLDLVAGRILNRSRGRYSGRFHY